ncbi:MAG: cadherin-like domain-containing protein [Phycisphaerae bacterium]|nr:cadherin-like domain-containing protein [Phycisphaerae bacterium]
MTLHHMLPDTPTHRINTANTVGLTGTHREVFLNCYLHVGDNLKAPRGQIESIRDFMTYEPREIFPDAVLTLNHYNGAGRGGMVNSFGSTKNTFNFGEGSNSSEWAGDLVAPIESILGAGADHGDYFTFVMGHEATHSLDKYVNDRANKDMRRRWGQYLTMAAGPDVIAGSNGWWDWNATKANFQTKGYWDGTSDWNEALSTYWSTGPGSVFNTLASMRINIQFFLGAPQESLATQANHHWANSEGRIISAIDRWRRGVENGIEPMKANINECVTFIDFVSAGLNKVVMYDTHGVSSPYKHATYAITRAWLQRNDKGYITRITIGDRIYSFEVDDNGVITDVITNIFKANNDTAQCHTGLNKIDALANDNKLEGAKGLTIGNFSQASHGLVRVNLDNTFTYVPDSGFSGNDAFIYTATDPDGNEAGAKVSINILTSSAGVLAEAYTGISGSSIVNLTSNSKFPNNPDMIAILEDFESPTNLMDNYGLRLRAWLKVPTTGDYTFWIATDDNGQLFLSSDENPENSASIAYVSNYTSPRQWDKETSQQSAPVTLTAGQYYYIEALMKEGSGGDNCAVAFQGPGISQQVIPGQYLYAYGSNINDNSPPIFKSLNFTKNGAVEGFQYQGSITDDALDVDSDDNISFAKLDGPDWLTVEPDGTLAGLPVNDNTGNNEFTVKVTDNTGLSESTTMTINVNNMYTGELGTTDLAGMLSYWLSTNCDLCHGADLSGDGKVNLADIASLANNWLFTSE